MINENKGELMASIDHNTGFGLNFFFYEVFLSFIFLFIFLDFFTKKKLTVFLLYVFVMAMPK